MSEQVFLAYWSNEGFESIQDITEYKHAELLTALDAPGAQEKVKELNSMINSMELRARMNPQRNYECYVVTAAESVSLEDLKTLAFNDSPQAAANLFRDSGAKIFSFRETAQRVIE